MFGLKRLALRFLMRIYCNIPRGRSLSVQQEVRNGGGRSGVGGGSALAISCFFMSVTLVQLTTTFVVGKVVFKAKGGGGGGGSGIYAE